MLQSVLPSLGRILRLYREKSGRNLGSVAEKADISISMLSQIERGVVSPSIDTLVMVCRALDLDMAELFRSISPESPVRVHRRGERLKMDSKGVCYEQLMTSHGSFPAELFMIEVESGSATTMSGSGHEGVEMGYVLSGSASLTVGENEYKINEGDSLFFSAQLPHRLVNSGSEMFRAVWSTSPPNVDYLRNA
ncbi:MAG: XRE family transcriptional regulator [Chitinispirillaceae bacterium]|nr:XRE family transcriptional regulator [Chitinispirillaceae bacterium]